MTKIRGRFEVLNENGWMLIDNKWNRTLSFDNVTRARAAAAFARLYVRLWGDINFCSFPYTELDPLMPFCEDCGGSLPCINHSPICACGSFLPCPRHPDP